MSAIAHDERKHTIGIGLIGPGFMGRVHSQAWRTASRMFPLPLHPELAVLCGRNLERTATAARQMGWAKAATDWRSVVEHSDLGVIDICTPGDTHAEIAIAALEAGRHVMVEKPLANTVAEALAMVAAADEAAARGVRSMVGFNYRRLPAIQLAKKLVQSGEIGRLRQVRARYLQDWLTDSDAPFGWRLDAAAAGSGALGDLGAHIVDLTEYVTGQRIVGVNAQTETFVQSRPLAAGSGHGAVTVDDTAVWLARYDGAVIGTLEATRVATGKKNALQLEINGETGSLGFDLERLNELTYYTNNDRADARGFRTVHVTEAEHPYLKAWWPAGHSLGYEHAFVHQAADFLTSISEETAAWPSFRDGLHVQRVLDAVLVSAATGGAWTVVEADSPPSLHMLLGAANAARGVPGAATHGDLP